jgi:thiamine pyrophosphokinase
MRLDHTIGNLLLLTLPALHAVEVRLVHESGEVFVARNYSPLKGTPGDYVSLLPISDRVEGVVTAGLRYSLHGETLHRGSTRGVSNELTESQAWITVSAGLLLVCHARGVSI